MSPPFDPRLTPRIAPTECLPPVPRSQLSLAALRSRFAQPPRWQPEITADSRLFDEGRAIVPASVLVPLVSRSPGHLEPPHVLLTRRTAHLSSHAGQISFPGGRQEISDAHEVATALREAQEEVGLHPERVEVLGSLPPYLTATGFLVTPIVGLIQVGRAEREALELLPDPHEVAEIFEVPLSFLMDPAHHHRHQVELGERSVGYYAMPWRAPGHDDDHFIWGATAAMLRNLYRFLSA